MITLRAPLLRTFFQKVWNEGNVEDLPRFIADRYTIHHDPGDPWEGQTLDRRGFMERLSVSRAPFPDQTFIIREILSSDDALAATWLWSGTHKGEIAGFAPTGRTIRMSGITVYYFDRRNLLTGHWQVTDRLGIFQQLAANARG